MHFLLSVVAVGMMMVQDPDPKLDDTVLPPPGGSKAESKESQTQKPAPHEQPAPQEQPASPKTNQPLELFEDDPAAGEIRPTSRSNQGRRVAAFWIIVPNSR